MIAKTNDPVMKKAVRIIYDMSEDTRVRELARMREKAIRDDASMRAQERAAERASIIEAMKRSGLSDAEIKRILSFRQK